MDYKNDKGFRLLHMQNMLNKGLVLRKSELAAEMGVAPKSIQRDIDSLRLYLAETGGELVYSRKHDHYSLERKSIDNLTGQEVYALCKILIESRALNKNEFENITHKLLVQLPQGRKQEVESIISDERHNYIPLKHGKELIHLLWELSQYITKRTIITFRYTRQDGGTKTHTAKPVGIVFSEFYFYLIAYLTDENRESYTVFRVDRMGEPKTTGESFFVPYSKRFSESEFKKRIQFMYAGNLKTVRFVYRGVLEAALDRLPTAEIVETRADKSVVIKAEVFGRGIDMWLKSQGELVEVLT